MRQHPPCTRMNPAVMCTSLYFSSWRHRRTLANGQCDVDINATDYINATSSVENDELGQLFPEQQQRGVIGEIDENKHLANSLIKPSRANV